MIPVLPSQPSEPAAQPGPGNGSAREVTIDLAGLETELRDKGFSARSDVVTAYLLRFGQADDATLVEQLSRSAGWIVASYTDATDRLVRLTREGRLTNRQLRQDLAYVQALCRDHRGHCDGLVVEDLTPGDYWDAIAKRLITSTRTTDSSESAPEAALGA